MKTFLTAVIFSFVCLAANAQGGSGIGYIFDIGGSNWKQSNPDYFQSIRTITHNGFIRFHNTTGTNAFQLMVGYRIDSIRFRNYSSFLAPDGRTMMKFNTDAYLKRNAWKVAAINQLQFGRRPGRFMVSLNTGLFYEYAIRASRFSFEDRRRYKLNKELNRHNMGVILGGEVRLRWFTIGCKYEKLLGDMLNHNYILSEELNLENSSELRGLRLNPGMWFLTLGVNLDFFEEPSKDG